MANQRNEQINQRGENCRQVGEKETEGGGRFLGYKVFYLIVSQDQCVK